MNRDFPWGPPASLHRVTYVICISVNTSVTTSEYLKCVGITLRERNQTYFWAVSPEERAQILNSLLPPTLCVFHRLLMVTHPLYESESGPACMLSFVSVCPYVCVPIKGFCLSWKVPHGEGMRNVLQKSLIEFNRQWNFTDSNWSQ